MSSKCYICNSGNGELLEEHHIVPRRFGGGDESANIVGLCPNCHRALERLYDKRFYDELDVEKEGIEVDEGQHICGLNGCTSKDTGLVEHEYGHRRGRWVCEGHQTCFEKSCQSSEVMVVESAAKGHVLVCDTHRVCNSRECENAEVCLYETDFGFVKPFCGDHAAERGLL